VVFVHRSISKNEEARLACEYSVYRRSTPGELLVETIPGARQAEPYLLSSNRRLVHNMGKNMVSGHQYTKLAYTRRLRESTECARLQIGDNNISSEYEFFSLSFTNRKLLHDGLWSSNFRDTVMPTVNVS
jgi:hypothetical protein